MSLLIKNGKIISDNKQIIADILCENGKISKVGKIETEENIETIDASGKLVFPGGVDPHVHMELPSPAGPSSDNFESGSKAALAGGTTTIIDFVTPSNRDEAINIALEKRLKEAEKSVCDYSFHLSPLSWSESIESEIISTVSDIGINSFKTYLAYKDVIGIDDYTLLRIMESVKMAGGILAIHAEDGDLITYLRRKFIDEVKLAPQYHPISRPNFAESYAVQKVINYSKLTDCPVYLVHISTAESIKMLRKAQSEGVQILAETCPHYLLLDESVYHKDFNASAKYVLSPPLRHKIDQDELWKAIADGVIQTIGTDHCPFNLNGQKDKGKFDFTLIPNGAGSVEYRLALMFTYGVLENKIPIEQFVNLVSTNPARIFGLGDRKGVIEEGYDADIVVWDPEKETIVSTENQFQNCDSNIYEGFKLKGWPEYVITNGKVVVKNNNFTDNLSKGNFIHA